MNPIHFKKCEAYNGFSWSLLDQIEYFQHRLEVGEIIMQLYCPVIDESESYLKRET